MIAHKTYGIYERALKRPIDFLCALLALTILSPVLMAVGILVLINLGRPVFFVQKRIGRNGKLFNLYKFRSMKLSEKGNQDVSNDSERLTAFGKKLRSSSLDELPELVNVLKGEMSIVGPRPLLPQYLPRYNKHQARRHEVRPGFTGLAQIHGRNAISWEERFDWDVRYVDHITFSGDCKIIFSTIGMVFKRKGVSSLNSVTMEEFMGKEEPKS